MKTKPSVIPGLILIVVGFLLFFFGAGLDLTIVGLPAGIGVDALGILLIIVGLGMIGVNTKAMQRR